MATELAAELSRVGLTRKVWVVNHHDKPYREDVNGDMIEVPPNGVKKLLMPVLEANRFLGRPKAPGEKNPQGQWITGPKALEIVELTEEEMLKIEGKTPKDDAKTLKAMTEEAKAECTLCGMVAMTEKGLKTHITRMHPEYEIEEK